MARLVRPTFISIALTLASCAVTSPQQPAVQSVPAIGGYSNRVLQAGQAAAMAGLPSVAPQTPALIGILVQQLGISPVQAMGGAGAIFSTAKQVMAPTKFGLLSNAVPGMSQILSSAPQVSGYGYGANGLLGSAASALGGGNRLGQMAMLASSFQNLGLDATMVNRFIPVILQYVQAQGGPATMNLLQSALMP